MTYTSLLIHTCRIGSSSYTTNALGERSFSWTYSSTNTKCRMSPITAAERIDYAGKLDDVKYRAFFLSGASISTDSRIKYNSLYYEVKEKYYDSSGHHITCLLVER